MPPAGRAPPCTRWGASRPPDPGITADAKGFRIQLALDTEPFCVRRLVFVESPPFEVTVTRSIFVINTKNPRMRCRETFNKPRHAASPQPPSAPLTKVFEEEGGGLEGEGETFSESFPFPPPMFYSPPSFSECSFLKMVLRLTLKTSATFWTEPCTLRALRRMPRSMSAMMSLRGRS